MQNFGMSVQIRDHIGSPSPIMIMLIRPRAYKVVGLPAQGLYWSQLGRFPCILQGHFYVEVVLSTLGRGMTSPKSRA